MPICPVRTAAIKMAIPITIVAAVDAAAAVLAPRPQVWCALIPALIPMLTPAVIFSRRPASRG